MNELTICRTGLPYTQPQLSNPGSHHHLDTCSRLPVHAFPRELPQPSAPVNPGYTHTPPHLQLRTFPRSPPQPACTQSTMTSMLPCQPAYMPTCTPTLLGPPPTGDVLTSALPRPLTAPADFAYDTMQRLADCVDNRNNVYTNSIEQLLAHLPPPPPVNTQSVPLLSVCTQTTASAYVNTDSIPVLSAHRYAVTPFDSNYQNISANLSLPSLSTYTNVPTNVNAPLSQAIALGPSNVTQPSALYAASYASNLNSSSIIAFPPSVCTSYADNS